MAKGRDGGNQGGDGKLTVFFAHLEGNNESLQRALLTVTDAVEKAVGRPVVLRSTPAVTLGGAKSALPKGDTAPAQEIEDVVVEAPSEGSGAPTSAKPKSHRTVHTPTIVDVDLTSGDLPLKTYIAHKGDRATDTKRYLLIAHWLKEQGRSDIITPDLAYTCYKHLNWTSPDDIGNPLRNGKRDGVFNKIEGKKGAYSLNHIGEGRVREMTKSE